jgi:hypothetical protein
LGAWSKPSATTSKRTRARGVNPLKTKAESRCENGTRARDECLGLAWWITVDRPARARERLLSGG